MGRLMAKQKIIWENPPHIRTEAAYIDWEVVLTPLIRQPRRWARVAEKATPAAAYTMTSRLRLGALPIPKGRWEFASKGNRHGPSYIYARYLGREVKPK